MKLRIIKNGEDLYLTQKYELGEWVTRNKYIVISDAIDEIESLIELNREFIKSKEVKEIIREYSL